LNYKGKCRKIFFVYFLIFFLTMAAVHERILINNIVLLSRDRKERSMNSFAIAAIAASTLEKFSGLLNSQRIFKSHVQTIFTAVDSLTPAMGKMWTAVDKFSVAAKAADKMSAFQAIMPPRSAAEIIISDHVKRAEVFSSPLMKAARLLSPKAPVARAV
jgi:hypothetical protein